MSKRTIDNSQDILDSREVIARIAELEDERDTIETDAGERWDEDKAVHDAEQHETEQFIDCRVCHWGREVYVADTLAEQFLDADELKALLALQADADGSADWRHGETLIRDSYFERYAQELAEDCGMLKDTNSWPNNHIDWEAAAEALQMDYTSVDFDGVTYWIRS